MDEISKLKMIEKALDTAPGEVMFARKLIRTFTDDYNTVYPEGLDHFVNQLRNYKREYTAKTNVAIRCLAEINEVVLEVVKKGGTENQ